MATVLVNPKPPSASRTIWVNVLVLVIVALTAVLNDDMVKEHPQLTLWFGMALALANIGLRFLTEAPIVYAVLLVLSLAPSASAQVQVCTPDKLAALKASLPATENPRWQKLFDDPRTMFYTNAEIPAAYQHAPGGLIVGGGFVGRNTLTMQTTFHSPSYNISGDFGESQKPHGMGGNANIEFPWRTPGGTDWSEGRSSTFKFLRLPDRNDGGSNGGVWPVVWYQPVMRDSRVGPHTVLAWTFPVGTIFGEVMALKDSRGVMHTFEVRLRIREANFWDIEILRPFPTAKDLADRLESMDATHYAADIALLRNPRTVTAERLHDTLHRTVAFDVRAGTNLTPTSLTEAVSAQLLDTTPFKSAVGAAWKSHPDFEGLVSFAPRGRYDFGIVPKDYEGTFMGTDTDSCKRCHEHTLRHADAFDSVRQWYGRVRGSDQIFTWHPIDPRSIAYNGATVPVNLRPAFVQAGIIEKFDPAKHPADRYTQLK